MPAQFLFDGPTISKPVDKNQSVNTNISKYRMDAHIIYIRMSYHVYMTTVSVERILKYILLIDVVHINKM